MDWLDQMDALLEAENSGPGGIHVVNINTYQRCDPELEEFTYVGRGVYGQTASPLGNPYKVSEDLPRGESLGAYRNWLFERMSDRGSAQRAEMRRLAEVAAGGKDVALACWCHPKHSCHAEIIKEYLDKMVEKILILEQKGSP